VCTDRDDNKDSENMNAEYNVQMIP
jgi:hypothetical protein